MSKLKKVLSLRGHWLGLMSLVLLLGLNSCQPATNEDTPTEMQANADGLYDYPIEPVDIREVKLTDEFWLPIVQRVQEKTIEFALEKCKEEGRFENFLIAGGELDREVRGYMPFDDTDVYKIIEGASNSLIRSPNEKVEEDRGKVALEYGPVVYTVEEMDNSGYFDAIKVAGSETFDVSWNGDLLKGVNVVEAKSEAGSFKAIPYYAWSNRGIGKMKVWLPETSD